MNPLMIPVPRRLVTVLIVLGGFASSAGCGGDETVRGAGSIDIPIESLKFEPKTKGALKAPEGTQRP
jgi:hypothetical protein